MSVAVVDDAIDVGVNKQHQLTAALPRTIIIIISSSSSSINGGGAAGPSNEHLAVTHPMDVALPCPADMSPGLIGSSISISEPPQDLSSMTLDSVKSASSTNLLYR